MINECVKLVKYQGEQQNDKSPNHIIQLIEQEMLNKELDLSVNNYLYTSDEWKITR